MIKFRSKIRYSECSFPITRMWVNTLLRAVDSKAYKLRKKSLPASCMYNATCRLRKVTASCSSGRSFRTYNHGQYQLTCYDIQLNHSYSYSCTSVQNSGVRLKIETKANGSVVRSYSDEIATMRLYVVYTAFKIV